MRFVVALALMLSACTRANPDAVGGGGSGGGGGGAAGSGGGGSAGSGGSGGGADLSVVMPHDLAMGGPADMTSFEGVYCGTLVCTKPTDECCVTQALGTTCQSPAIQCTGRAFDCDGPEDCPMAGDRCCGSINGSACGANGGGGCSNGDVPLCHTLADCGSGGYVGCCGASNGGHLRFCSKNPCM
jgi:hypothetical protein